MSEVVQEVKVKNRAGLHTRPATAIVKILMGAKCDVSFTYKKMTINAKSILSLLALSARRNAKILITCSGEDAGEVMQNLIQGFDSCFGEKWDACS